MRINESVLTSTLFGCDMFEKLDVKPNYLTTHLWMAFPPANRNIIEPQLRIIALSMILCE